MKKKLLLILMAVLAAIPSFAAVYLNYDAGNGSWESAQMSQSGSTYTYTFEVGNNSGSCHFLFTSNGQHPWTGNNSTVYSADANNDFGSYSNGQIDFTKTYGVVTGWNDKYTWYTNEKNITILITLNTSTNKVTFVKQTTPVEYKYCIRGEIFGTDGGAAVDGTWADFPMTKQSDGTWKIVNKTVTKTGNFGIKRELASNNNHAEDAWINSSASNTTVTLNSNLGASTSGSNWYIPGDLAGGTYTFTFNPTSNILRIEGTALKDEFTYTPSSDGYIYFNAGAGYYTEDFWKKRDGSKPNFYCYLVYGSNTYTIDMALTDDDTPMFRGKIPTQASGQPDAIYFKTETDYFDGGFQYCGHLSQDYRKDQWNYFIYGPGDGSTNDNRQAHQSYCTYAMYQKLHANKGTDGIYFVGQNLYDLENNKIGDWDLASLIPAVKADGVYIMPLSFTNNTGDKKFKISFIDPESLNQVAPYQNLRWWATFNLGIVGPSRHRYTSNGNSEYGNEKDENIPYSVGQTIGYNHYNQYNWLVQKSQSEMWMVIDPTYGSVCMLPFDPQPDFADENNNILATLSHVAVSGTPDGLVIPGPAGAPNANFKLMNLLSGSATIKAADHGTFTSYASNFTVKYQLYYVKDGVTTAMAPIDGVIGQDQTIDFNSLLPTDDNSKVYLRAIYTDKTNYVDEAHTANLQFRSRIRDAKVVLPNIQLNALESTNVMAHKHNYKPEGVDKETTMPFDLILGIEYDFPQGHNYLESAQSNATSLAVYPSISVKANNQDGKLLDKNYEYLQKESSVKAKYIDGPGYNLESDNWSHASAMCLNSNKAGYFPMYVPAVATAKTDAISVSYSLTAHYPFLVYIEGTSANNAPARRAGTINGKTYGIVTVPVTRNYNNVQDQITFETSGIEDVMMGESSEAFELYNLQGVRVLDEAPAPGIYIRRAADGTASKVIIR